MRRSYTTAYIGAGTVLGCAAAGLWAQLCSRSTTTFHMAHLPSPGDAAAYSGVAALTAAVNFVVQARALAALTGG
jgi:hypothetical protein